MIPETLDIYSGSFTTLAETISRNNATKQETNKQRKKNTTPE